MAGNYNFIESTRHEAGSKRGAMDAPILFPFSAKANNDTGGEFSARASTQ
jgi:hypothetical protein